MYATHAFGTYRSGPLLQVSLVGTAHEEVGDYFPDYLDIMESQPFLKAIMPWGPRSIYHETEMQHERSKSDDGPILWTRPGEQVGVLARPPQLSHFSFFFL